MHAERTRRFLTLDDYFMVEQMSDVRHEYVEGDVLAMAGGSPRHNQIASNLVRVVGNALVGTGCRVFGSDQHVATPDGLYTYADAVVFCGPIELVGGRPATATNPVLLVEVLSESTRSYDRGEKLDRYRTITSLREILLVDPDPVGGVERWVRTDDGWRVLPVDGGALELVSGRVVVSMADLYRDVEGLAP